RTLVLEGGPATQFESIEWGVSDAGALAPRAPETNRIRAQLWRSQLAAPWWAFWREEAVEALVVALRHDHASVTLVSEVPSGFPVAHLAPLDGNAGVVVAPDDLATLVGLLHRFGVPIVERAAPSETSDALLEGIVPARSPEPAATTPAEPSPG